MRILMVVASLHGSTWEVAEAIAQGLRADRHAVHMVPADDAPRDLTGVDAVVLGSAVYLMQWMKPLRSWVADHREMLAEVPHAVFSVGLSGRRPVLPAGLTPRSHGLFLGRVDPSVLLQGMAAPVPTGARPPQAPLQARTWAAQLPDILV